MSVMNELDILRAYIYSDFRKIDNGYSFDEFFKKYQNETIFNLNYLRSEYEEENRKRTRK